MGTLFLHVGSGKTGTSALQAAFAKNAAVLRRHGIIYPDSPSNEQAAEGRITSGNGFGLAVYLDPRLQGNVGQDHLAALVHELNESHGQNVLYSSEFMSRFRPDLLKRLVEAASCRGFTTKIVFYIRSIAGHAYSVYSQAVKRRQCSDDFSTFVLQYRNRFSEIIEKSEQIISKENLIVRNFDTARSNIFRDFAEGVLGIPHNGEEMSAVPVVNRSLSAFEIEFLRSMNGMFDTREQSAFVSDSLIYSTPELESCVVISPDQLKILEERFGDTVRIVNKYIEHEGISILDKSIQIGERPRIALSEFERCMLSVVTRLVPHRGLRQRDTRRQKNGRR